MIKGGSFIFVKTKISMSFQ